MIKTEWTGIDSLESTALSKSVSQTLCVSPYNQDKRLFQTNVLSTGSVTKHAYLFIQPDVLLCLFMAPRSEFMGQILNFDGCFFCFGW